MRFLNKSEVAQFFAGKTVAIVGSGPGVLDNDPGRIDGHDVVVRVNNYKVAPEVGGAAGRRCDVHYSFYGGSIRKSARDLQRDGVRLCMCKCPNDQVIESEWHRRNNKMMGVDFRWIYAQRKAWWWCDTYIPTVENFLQKFKLLDGHIPTTGFAAILDIISFQPRSLFLTGFDFFSTQRHNVNEPWRNKNQDDPVRHVPEQEFDWLARNLSSLTFSVEVDRKLTTMLSQRWGATARQFVLTQPSVKGR